MRKLNVANLAVLVALGLFAAVVSPAEAASATIDTPVVSAWALGSGSGHQIELQCGGRVETPAGPGVVLRNAGPETALVFLAGGGALLVQAGEEVTLIGEAAAASNKCVCKCTCSGEGHSGSVTFDCDANTGDDKCPTSNGSTCLYFDSNNKLQEGTLQGCKRAYIPIISTPTETTP